MKKLTILFTILIPLSLQAAELDSKDTARNLVKNVMSEIAKNNTIEGVSCLKPYSVIPDEEFDTIIEQLKIQSPKINKRFGNVTGIEFITEEEVGESLFRIIYIQKFERYVMRWSFYFYKPKDKWVIITLFTDDKIEYLFKR